MKVRLLLGGALAAFFLYLSLRSVDFGEIRVILLQARYSYFFAFLAINLVSLWLRALRWRYLLSPVRTIPAGRLLSPLCIGLMANFIFPARAGEVVRAYLVGRREGVSKSAVFATVVVERLFDGLAIISFLAMAPFFFGSAEKAMTRHLKWAGAAVLIFYVAVLVALFFLSHHREWLSGYLGNSRPAKRWKLVARLIEVVRKFTDGLVVLKSPGAIVGALSLSLVIWVMAAVTNLVMMRSVGLVLPLYAAFFLVVVQSFGVMVPTPGFVGSYQYAHIVALSVYGIADSSALGLAILIHAGYFVLFMAAGLFFLGREHLGLKELKTVSSEEGDGPSRQG